MKKRLLTSVFALTFAGLQMQAQTTPKLVVTLTIDQLRADYMENFSALYGEKGFKRLLRDGKAYTNATFPFSDIDRSSAIAAIHTGVPPYLNGIIANSWLDITSLRPMESVDDSRFKGSNTNEGCSPENMLTSTMADELKISTRGASFVYAIAPYKDAAILGAGHAANGAFWMNEETGKWCSTTYYKEFPLWLNQFNERKGLDFRIKDISWTPAREISEYRYLPEWRSDAFKYKFDGDKLNKYRHLLTSPYANEEVNLLAEELLEKSDVGKDDITDFLSLTYYAGNYRHRSAEDCAMEIQDAYVRLDNSIAYLIELLDRKIGLKNVLLCIASTGYSELPSPDNGAYNIPGGEFHMNRCSTLLNMYLMATYGQGQYVEGVYGQQIYLNHKLIEEKQLSLTEIQEKSADFLSQFSGVCEVYSSHRLLLGSWSPEVNLHRNSYHRKHSGDLTIEVLPGWTIIRENNVDNRTQRYSYSPAPVFIFGAGTPAEVVRTPVNICRLAPTICGILRIRAPNACKEQAIY